MLPILKDSRVLSSRHRSVPDSALEGTMRWYFFVSYFFGGAFLVNAIPHFVQGVPGRSFPTPFASPPGKGQSSPTGHKTDSVFRPYDIVDAFAAKHVRKRRA
jgi:hypothetical protein